MSILTWYVKKKREYERYRIRKIIDCTIEDCREMGVITDRKRVCRILGYDYKEIFPEDDTSKPTR